MDMTKKIKKAKNFFSIMPVKNKRANTSADVQQAAAVLMIKMAAADDKVSRIEMIHISELLRKEFKLEQTELDSMILVASSEDVLSTPTETLAKQICETLGNAKRVKLLEYLWILAYSDDNVDARETDFIRHIAQLLVLTDMQIANAQENAERHLGLGFF